MSADETWFILREPGFSPERKGPFRGKQVKSFLIELLEARPSAFITVLDLGYESGPMVEDGPQYLEMLDMRYHRRAVRHRASSAAAFANPPSRMKSRFALPKLTCLSEKQKVEPFTGGSEKA